MSVLLRSRWFRQYRWYCKLIFQILVYYVAAQWNSTKPAFTILV